MDEVPGLLIVTLREEDDAQKAKRRISQIPGVVRVEFNLLNRKLFVTYGNKSPGLGKIEDEIKKALESLGKDSDPRPRKANKRR